MPQEESMLQNGTDNDFVIHLLKKYNIPITRENYMGLAYPNADESVIDESSIPEQLRKK